jgi:hypothetical protein
MLGKCAAQVKHNNVISISRKFSAFQIVAAVKQVIDENLHEKGRHEKMLYK